MSRSFIHAKPLQALKLGAVLAIFWIGLLGIAGLIPGLGLDTVLILAFVPLGFGPVVGAEALYAVYRIARDDRGKRIRRRPLYTAIRALELGATIGAPVTFYVLIGAVGNGVATPGTGLALLLFGVGLGLLAFGAVFLRTVAEYYYHRKHRAMSSH